MVGTNLGQPSFKHVGVILDSKLTFDFHIRDTGGENINLPLEFNLLCCVDTEVIPKYKLLRLMMLYVSLSRSLTRPPNNALLHTCITQNKPSATLSSVLQICTKHRFLDCMLHQIKHLIFAKCELCNNHLVK